jgi:hypothetical protein
MTRIHKVGATTRFIAPTNTKGSRIKVTMAGRSKIVSKQYCNDEHMQAIQDAWEFFGFGEFRHADYVAESESGRGSVYVVTYTVKG